MSETVEVETDTLIRLIEGASHLYYPAFPDNDNRAEIGFAVNRAEERLEEAQ